MITLRAIRRAAPPRCCVPPTLFALLLTVLPLSDSTADDRNQLFSEISMSQVVAQEQEKATAGTDSGVGETVLGHQTLADLLVAAGLDAKATGRRVAVSLQADGLRDKMSFFVDAEAGRIELELPVWNVKNVDRLSSKRLIGWMTLANAHPQTSFVFNETESKVLLKHWIDNRKVTTDDLEQAVAKVRDLAQQAVSQQAVSQQTVSQQTVSQQTVSQQTVPTSQTTLATKKSVSAVVPTVPPSLSAKKVVVSKPTEVKPLAATRSSSLTGTWSAKRSDQEAFAIRFDVGNRFQLVHFNNGKSNVSQGSIQFGGGKLVLSGDDGTKISGLFAVASKAGAKRKAFSWSLTDNAGNVVMKLTFVAQ